MTDHADIDHTGLTGVGGLSNPMTTAGDIIYSSDGSGTPAALAAGSDGEVLTLASGVPSWAAASGGGSSLLGVTRYQPGSDSTIYTCTTTPALADTTNLAVTFTAPASGNIIVRFTGAPNTGSGGDQFWAVWESGALVGTNTRKVSGSSIFGSVCASFYLTSVSAGSHTYKWAAYKVASAASLLSGGPLYGACLMEVWSA